METSKNGAAVISQNADHRANTSAS